MDFLEEEARDGVRMSWNVWPSTRTDMTRMVVPVGAMYSPLKPTQNLHTSHYEPIRCRSGQNCACILNPMCRLDFNSKTWQCNFCTYRNPFPPMYAERISEQCLPAECQKSTIEYVLPPATGSCAPPAFLFVLDSALNQLSDEAEFLKAKDVLQQTLQSMPQNALVGFITYGTMVNVHEVGCADIVKSFAFRGTKQHSKAQVAATLGLPLKGHHEGGGAHQQNNNHGGNQQGGGAQNRFLLPVSECEFAFNTILDDLQKDKWPSGDNSETRRTARCTGAALGIAVGLMENLYAGSAGRVVLVASGPCTVGPGHIVSQQKSEMLRSHNDMQKGNENAQWLLGGAIVSGCCPLAAAAGAGRSVT